MAQRSAESCRRFCIYCVHISVRVRFDQWSFASILYNITILNKKLCLAAIYLILLNGFMFYIDVTVHRNRFLFK